MIESSDFPLERWANPYLFDAWKRRRRNTTVTQFDSKAIALLDESFNGQPNWEVVNRISIDIDVIVEQDNLSSNKKFTGEGSFNPCFMGRAIVSWSEVDIDCIGVNSNAQWIAKA